MVREEGPVMWQFANACDSGRRKEELSCRIVGRNKRRFNDDRLSGEVIRLYRLGSR